MLVAIISDLIMFIKYVAVKIVVVELVIHMARVVHLTIYVLKI